MTSGHRLAAIVVIWVVVGAMGLMLPGLSLSLDSTLLIVFYAVLTVAAGAGTVAIALSARGGGPLR